MLQNIYLSKCLQLKQREKNQGGIDKCLTFL